MTECLTCFSTNFWNLTLCCLPEENFIHITCRIINILRKYRYFECVLVPHAALLYTRFLESVRWPSPTNCHSRVISHDFHPSFVTVLLYDTNSAQTFSYFLRTCRIKFQNFKHKLHSRFQLALSTPSASWLKPIELLGANGLGRLKNKIARRMHSLFSGFN